MYANNFFEVRRFFDSVFGKLFKDSDRMLMPLSVEANHTIMDGFHVGKFFTCYQDSLNSVRA